MKRPGIHKNRRQAARFRGRMAESVASLALWLGGYRILARQYRVPAGEIDIIARRKNMVIFVEVKARATERLALESLSVRQCNRITRAAETFMQKNRGLETCDVRFDMICIVPWRWPGHLKNAWQKT